MPEEIGILWSMPLGSSTPAEHSWESALFVPTSLSDTQIAMGAFRVAADIDMTIGQQPEWEVIGGESALLRIYYEIA